MLPGQSAATAGNNRKINPNLGWKLFMGAPEVKDGLAKLGFTSPNL